MCSYMYVCICNDSYRITQPYNTTSMRLGLRLGVAVGVGVVVACSLFCA